MSNGIKTHEQDKELNQGVEIEIEKDSKLANFGSMSLCHLMCNQIYQSRSQYKHKI
jgi:hypothetical protein